MTLLIRVQRQGQRLMAVGLSDHYRQILALTRLDEAIGIHATEAEALAAERDAMSPHIRSDPVALRSAPIRRRGV